MFDPDGEEVVLQGAVDPRTPVAQGWLRASHRKLDPERSTEYRPYHTHDEVWPRTPGETVEADVEIWPTSLIVPAGYRIALTVRGRDYEHAVGDAASLSHFRERDARCGHLHARRPRRSPEGPLRRHDHRDDRWRHRVLDPGARGAPARLSARFGSRWKHFVLRGQGAAPRVRLLAGGSGRLRKGWLRDGAVPLGTLSTVVPALVLTIGFLATACPGASTPEGEGGAAETGAGDTGAEVANPGVLIHALGGEPEGLDPARLDEGGRGSRAIIQSYEFLVDIPPEGAALVPGLATEVPSQENGLVSRTASPIRSRSARAWSSTTAPS